MIANTLTLPDAEQVADALIESLTPVADDVPGYITAWSEAGDEGDDDDGDDWFAVAVIRDTARGKWLVATRDPADNAVTEHEDVAAAVEDAATFLAVWYPYRAQELRDVSVGTFTQHLTQL